MTEQAYDLLVIGAGAAGSSAASAARKDGRRVALVERNILGGTCLNYGCDPTKVLLHTARLLYQARYADRDGLRIAQAQADWAQVLARVQQVIKQLRGGTNEEASAQLTHEGIDVLQGEASFVTPHKLSVAGQSVEAERIIIAIGCETLVPPIEGLREAGYITNVQAVSLPHLPRRLAIIGGGAIGIEFAQMFQRFGVEITVLERGSQMLDKEDRELAEPLCKLLSQEGIRMETGAELRRVRKDGECKRLTVRHHSGAEEEMVVDEILLALGRRPMLESLKLEAAGVKTGKKGIEVDATLRTNIPHIWAAGDVTGGYQFTHVASEQGKLAARNAFARDAQPFDDRAIPWATFSDPALAHVGKTEEQLREKSIAYRVGRMSFSQNERAIIEGETAGLVKLLVDEQGMILGGHVLAAHGDDLLAPIVVAMHAKIPVSALANTILPYPTLSEAVRAAAGVVGK
ncbi:MAG TPA: FAD-dependent oxidoreductase [Ktedonobacteraceae bacterium]|nr:FAD-dependent oxidoreductase [Ktedonobacteraceae bacterium]